LKKKYIYKSKKEKEYEATQIKKIRQTQPPIIEKRRHICHPRVDDKELNINIYESYPDT